VQVEGGQDGADLYRLEDGGYVLWLWGDESADEFRKEFDGAWGLEVWMQMMEQLFQKGRGLM